MPAAKSQPSILETKGLSKVYKSLRGSVLALSDISLAIPPGITGLVGSNGSGKSTLIRLLTTLEQPTRGEICFHGLPLRNKQRRRYRQTIGYVPQDVRFVPTMNCREALLYVGWVAGLDAKTTRSRIPEVLALVGLANAEKQPTRALSGGQNRRLGVAAALIHDPKILLLDEPTAGLDPQARIQVRNIISTVGTKIPVVVSTHLSDDVTVLADHVIALHQGKVAFAGPWKKLDDLGRMWDMRNAMADPLERALAALTNNHDKEGSAHDLS